MTYRVTVYVQNKPPFAATVTGGNEWRVEYTPHYGLKGVVRA